MPQRPSNRLSIDQIARLWAAENENAAFGAEDIAEELLQAAESGAFEHPTHSREDAPLGEYTYKEDWIDPRKSKTLKGEQPYVGPYRSALTMEGGQSVNAIDIQNYLKARQTAPGAKDRETRRTVASEIFLCVEEFQRWCDEPRFTEWANLRELSRPRFIDRASGDGPGGASTVDQEPDEADAPVPSPPREKAPKPRGRGRPSFQAEIEVAYLALEKDKKVDFDGFISALYEPIRKRVRKALGKPNLSKGLSDETIRTTILPLFEAGKVKKQSSST